MSDELFTVFRKAVVVQGICALILFGLSVFNFQSHHYNVASLQLLLAGVALGLFVASYMKIKWRFVVVVRVLSQGRWSEFTISRHWSRRRAQVSYEDIARLSSHTNGDCFAQLRTRGGDVIEGQ